LKVIFRGVKGHDIARKVRGALWPLLSANASDEARQGLACVFTPACPLDVLWNDFGPMHRKRELPKPWVLRAEKVEGADQAYVQFVLFGMASVYAEAVADLLLVAFDHGIGSGFGHGPWNVVDHEIYDDEGVIQEYLGDQTTLKLISPMKLAKDGRPADSLDGFLTSIIDRVDGLGRWHGLKLDCDFKTLKDTAREVRLSTDSLTVDTWSRVSGRSEKEIPMTVIRGSIDMAGPLDEISPYLRLAPIIHVGKDTRHGLGWVKLLPWG